VNVEVLEKLPPLLPLEFFSIEGQLYFSKILPSAKAMRKSHLLPRTSEWLGEERFADVAVAWNATGLFACVFVDQLFEQSLYPRFSEGDAFELFLDTRDLKTAGFATRFCHHFVFLPEAVQGIQAQELTHFRTEDTHPLCDASELQISTGFSKKGYEMQIFIPAHCLHGYDPSSFERIGLTYRVHRGQGTAQHFSLSSQHFTLEQHPRLWETFKFVS
jgi:hypothetical protein